MIFPTKFLLVLEDVVVAVMVVVVLLVVVAAIEELILKGLSLKSITDGIFSLELIIIL